MQQKKLEHWPSLALIGLIVTSSISFQAVSPAMLGGMVDQLGFSKQIIGWVVAVTAFGVALAGIFVSFLLPRFGSKALVRVGLSVLIVSEIAAAFVSTPAFMILLRFVAGLFGGLSYASALSSFAGLKQPVRGFSIYTIIFCLFSALILFLLPQLIANHGLRAGFFTLAFFAFFSLLASSILTPYSNNAKRQKVDQRVLRLLGKREIFFTVLAYFALQAGAVALWAFMERIGVERGHSTEFVSLVLSLTGIGGILGAILVNVLRNRLGLLKAVLFAFPVIIISILSLLFTEGPNQYLIAIFAFATMWGFTLPFYQGVQAAYDPQGKIVSLGAFMNMLGQASGPALASMLLGNHPYVYVVWISLGMFAVSLVTIVPAILGLGKNRSSY